MKVLLLSEVLTQPGVLGQNLRRVPFLESTKELVVYETPSTQGLFETVRKEVDTPCVQVKKEPDIFLFDKVISVQRSNPNVFNEETGKILKEASVANVHVFISLVSDSQIRKENDV